ncbi:MAG: HD domain-containing protein [Halobacteriota archaeon]|nr:HD domain-containing protein [Halobacteriota archaeon]
MKVIRDPIHGHVEVDEVGLKLLDTEEMQRLRRIRQLGFTYLVYPGANHTRFEHSLGTYHLANILIKQLKIECEELNAAALLHDICHGPYSHVTENVIFQYTKKTHEDVGDTITKGKIGEILKDFSIDPKVVSDYITGISGLRILHSEIDVDRMDYLIRDAYYTGVSFGMVDNTRLIHVMDVINGKLVVKIEGIQAVESLLVSRFLMRPTVYFHHVSRIAESMMVKALNHMIDEEKLDVFELRVMDDYELNTKMRQSEGYSQEIIEMINNRNLFKRAIYAGVDSINIGSLRKENRRLLEKEIAKRSGVDEKYVILDIPKEPKMEEMKANIVIGDDVKRLEEVSELVKMLELAQWENYKIGVYTLKKHKEDVAKAACEVLNVDKKPKQQFLEEFTGDA